MAGIMSEIEDMVNDHMDRQPYEITCSSCGGKLASDKQIDGDKDLILTVEPCERCLNAEYERGVKENENE